MAIFQSPINIFQGPKFPGISAERTIFAKFQAPKFENSEPEKMQFHTPSHSIPPLDSLLDSNRNPKFRLIRCDVFTMLGCAKGAAKASCGETVVQKGVFGESVSSLPP